MISSASRKLCFFGWEWKFNLPLLITYKPELKQGPLSPSQFRRKAQICVSGIDRLGQPQGGPGRSRQGSGMGVTWEQSGSPVELVGFGEAQAGAWMGHSRGRSVGSAEMWAVEFESSVAGGRNKKSLCICGHWGARRAT